MSINLRPATKSLFDVVFTWKLRNNNSVRKMSINTNKIPLEAHTDWYSQVINDNDSIFYIAEVESIPAGQVRLQKDNKKAYVNISIDEAFRGRGLSTDILNLIAEDAPYKGISVLAALIKGENDISKRAFAKAGFCYLMSADVGIEYWERRL